MAKQSAVDAALAKVRGQIADLQRVEQALIEATIAVGDAPKVRKPRKSKRGLPEVHSE